ncbi:MAG TPA: DMT family transporter [Chloroflexota bacterium]|nr:DMT family transporter [Chloroflexota bacterium]
MPNARISLSFLLLSLIWGSSYLFIRIGVEQISPVALVALRLFFAALAITVIALWRHADLRPTRRSLVLLMALAAVNTTIPFLLISWGEVQVQSGLAAVLNSTTPIFSILIAHLLLRDESLTLPRAAGIVIGFLGVLLVFSGGLSGGAVRWETLLSEGAIVVAAACYATSAVSVRRWLGGVPSLTISAYTIWFAAIQSIVISLIFSPPPLATMHGRTWFAVIWLGVLGSAIAYLLYYFLIMNWGASRATLVTYVVPAVGLVLGAVFLSEVIGWRVLAGAVLIIGGIVLAGLKRRPAPTAVAEHAAT